MTNMVCHLFTTYPCHGTGGTVKLYFSTSLFVVNSMKDLSNLYNAVSTGLWYNYSDAILVSFSFWLPIATITDDCSTGNRIG